MASFATDCQLHSEHRGAGDPLVLVHGFTQTGRSWAHLASRLRDRYLVTCVDLPGQGRSPTCDANDIPAAARLVAESCGAASYVGYSMGGRICLQLALDHPQLVERLVLVGATAGITSEVERADRRRSDEALAQRIDPVGGESPELSAAAFIASWLENPMFGDVHSSATDIAAREENTAAGLALALRNFGTGTQQPLQGRLHELSMPIMLVAGEQDTKFVEIARDMASCIGDNARVSIVPSCRHAVPFAQPESFEQLLRAFFDETTAR